MSDLVEFLLARIAEDEAVARSAGSDDVGREWENGLPATIHPDPTTYRTVVRRIGHVCGSILAADAEHIARWDPARVLAECEAKRRIVELHRSEPGYFHHGASTGSVAAWDSVPPDADIADGQPACTTCGEFSEYGVPWPCPTPRLLALPYADHDGYREEWRP